MKTSIYEELNNFDLKLWIEFNRFEDSTRVERVSVPLHGEGTASVSALGADWDLICINRGKHGRAEELAIQVTPQQSVSAVSVSVAWRVANWSVSNYVLHPGSIYAGNRFPAVDCAYPPSVPQEFTREDLGAGICPIISNMPRLGAEEEISRFQLLVRDGAAPALGYWSPQSQHGLCLWTPQRTSRGEMGLEVEESSQGDTAWLRISAPGIREERALVCGWNSSPDRAPDWNAGELLELPLRVALFRAPQVQGLYDVLWENRKTGPFEPTGAAPATVPFSHAWKLLEEKYNRDNWHEDAGLFATSTDLNANFIFQMGWCGGLLSSHPLLVKGNILTRRRAARTLETVCREGISPSGLFWSFCRGNGQWASEGLDHPNGPHAANWHLMRRDGDALFHGLKQLEWLEKGGGALGTPQAHLQQMERALERVAQALVEIWNRHGQWGQYCDQETGEVRVGGTSGAASVPAALELAARKFGCPEYRRVAQEGGRLFEAEFLQKGLTCGAPGDALQCPDSESAAALLESFVALWEGSEDEFWLGAAMRTARQFASWVMPCDYEFPQGSVFERMGMGTTGTVMANIQNRHSAPGLCTGSGLGLLKLFRATGEAAYFYLLQDIARSLPQFLSRPDRPITAKCGLELPSGWINERVNTSDWDQNIGGVFHGSTWSEVAFMLTILELPGVYVQPDSGFVGAFDHIEAEAVEHNQGGLRVRVVNPTAFTASFEVWSENATDARVPLHLTSALQVSAHTLGAGEATELLFPFQKCPLGESASALAENEFTAHRNDSRPSLIASV